MPWGSLIGPVLGLAGDLFGADKAADAQRAANKTNLRMAREQREWEAQMANTAVQRRRKDIEEAGFNPVLAAAGPGAATPSVSPPTAAPTFDAAWTKGSVKESLLAAEQLKLLKAQTSDVQASARVKNVEADLRENNADVEHEARRNKFLEQVEWDDLRTEIMRGQSVSSAAEGKRLRETADSMIAMARQQAKAGKLDLDALENIAKVGGLEAQKTTSILKLIIDLWRTSK